MTTYRVQTVYSFSGYFDIVADNAEDAAHFVKRDCGLVLGGGIHTTLDDNEIDWDFPVHPDCLVQHITLTPQNLH